MRARSDEEAAARLRAGFDSGSAELLQAFDALSRDHLVVHTGALMQSRALLSQSARAPQVWHACHDPFCPQVSAGRFCGFERTLQQTCTEARNARHAKSQADRLNVCSPGDLAQPNLGLEEGVYQQLCSDVDTVVHNGALVNHAYSYEQLFEPNVLGTVEVSTLIFHVARTCQGYTARNHSESARPDGRDACQQGKCLCARGRCTCLADNRSSSEEAV